VKACAMAEPTLEPERRSTIGIRELYHPLLPVFGAALSSVASETASAFTPGGPLAGSSHGRVCR